jgi:hypothetical protein
MNKRAHYANQHKGIGIKEKPTTSRPPYVGPKKEMVNHPGHYNFSKYEVIEVLDEWFSDNPLIWQVVKYLARAKHKGNELEDLKKAQFYLNRKIAKLENDIPKNI